MSSPETELFSAVINQALRDYNHLLRAKKPDHGGATDGIEARSFLTATHGPWKRSRIDICHCAGIDPDALRERVLATIERDGDLRSMLPKERRDKKPRDDA
jgi:hypothetical protein